MKKKTAIVEWKMPTVPQQKVLTKQTEPLLARAADFVIKSEDHFVVAGVMIGEIDRGIDSVEALCDPFCDGLYKLWQMALAMRKGFKNPLVAQKKRLHAIRTAWTEMQIEIKRKASEKMAAGLQAQHQRELERAAKAAERKGDTETAAALRIEKDQTPLPFFDITPPVPKQEGFYNTERWVFEITDPAAVEREFCSPDESLIRPVVESMGDKCKISGIRVWLDKKEHSRSIA